MWPGRRYQAPDASASIDDGLVASEYACREAAVWDDDLDDDRSDDADDNDGADQGKSILSPEIVAMKMGTITEIKATLNS